MCKQFLIQAFNADGILVPLGYEAMSHPRRPGTKCPILLYLVTSAVVATTYQTQLY